MQRLLLLICLLYSINSPSQPQNAKNPSVTAQQINWAKATNWKIYSLPGKQAANFPMDTLKNFKWKSLNEDSMRAYLTNAKPIKTSYGAVWQGYIVGTCEIDHTFRKVIFSTYGGFFFDPSSGRYFEIPKDLDLRKEWHEYLSNSLIVADPQASIP